MLSTRQTSMMQSHSLRERSGTDSSRAVSGRYHTGTDPPCYYFAAEDDRFLDAVAAALNQLTIDCKTALRWSHDDADADAAIQAAEQSFCSIVSICKEAGLTVNADVGGGDYDLAAWDRVHSTNVIFVPMQESITPRTNKPVDSVSTQDIYCEEVVHPPPAPIPRNSVTQREAVPLTPTEEIVEVELTDLLAQSHEEMLSLQRVFEDRMAAAEQTREEYEHKHTEEMQSLQAELANSRLAMDRIKQELLDSTTRKLEDMYSAITTSQKAIEAGMKDQTRYWKSICEELVVEKRDMAQKVAQERGRYTALKAHLASHEDTSTRLTPSSRVRIRDEESANNIRLCELSSSSAPEDQGPIEKSTVCISTCSTPTEVSSGLLVVPNADSVSESSSADVSPTHSNSSSNSKMGKPTFRRYYLAQKRENRVVLQ